MTDWIRCPKCGTVLINFLGFVCPSCGYRVPEQTIATLEGVYIENEPPKPNKNYVEVIRCKECKYFEIINGFEECNRYADETQSNHSTQPYGFCWLAERKEE